ncbi:MAG TPA: GNAT family N-acetyltransferase [Dehalococcoidia bacterium]|nr:GNAT family N-acetyltransferase [Dehalococcoidia bacterium]
MGNELRLIDRLEGSAFDAWPADEVQELDGWRLRFARGVTRRANSVWPNQTTGPLTLEPRLDTVETFYATRGQPSCFQLCPASRPGRLETLLKSRGYVRAAETAVQVAPIQTVLTQALLPSDASVRIFDTPEEEWLATYCQAEAVSESEADIRRAILQRIRRPTAYVLLSTGSQTVAVGVGVLDKGWVGVFCMATLGEFRRRGAATGVLHALAAWGARHGAREMYLQVMRENAPAVGLYGRLGFHTAYDYHYRIAQSFTHV